MPKIEEGKILLGNDNKLYTVKKIDACVSFCFYKQHIDCERRLKELFKYKLKFSSCKDLIGSNGINRQCFVLISGI